MALSLLKNELRKHGKSRFVFFRIFLILNHDTHQDRHLLEYFNWLVMGFKPSRPVES